MQYFVLILAISTDNPTRDCSISLILAVSGFAEYGLVLSLRGVNAFALAITEKVMMQKICRLKDDFCDCFHSLGYRGLQTQPLRV